MNDLMVALMVWASAQTGLPVPDELPTVKYADRCEIERIYYNDGARDCSKSVLRIQAIYLHDRDTIYLPDTFDVNKLFDVSVVLHELVHYMQDKAGMEMPGTCHQEKIERPAYDAQIAWLNATGKTAYDVMGINGLSYYILTTCAWD
jgi:hypothetical protein